MKNKVIDCQLNYLKRIITPFIKKNIKDQRIKNKTIINIFSSLLF